MWRLSRKKKMYLEDELGGKAAKRETIRENCARGLKASQEGIDSRKVIYRRMNPPPECYRVVTPCPAPVASTCVPAATAFLCHRGRWLAKSR